MPTVLFVWFDYQLNGTLVALLRLRRNARGDGRVLTWLILALRRLQNRRLLERLLLLWTLCGITVFALNARSVVHLNFWSLRVRSVCADAVFLGDAHAARSTVGRRHHLSRSRLADSLFSTKTPPTPVYTSNTAAVMLLTVISGYLIARRIRDYRVTALVAQHKLEHQARTDALTGIANRRRSWMPHNRSCRESIAMSRR